MSIWSSKTALTSSVLIEHLDKHQKYESFSEKEDALLSAINFLKVL